jgi:hypothetical protein
VDESYRGSDQGDPLAVPGPYPGPDDGDATPSFTLEVDGEVFAVRTTEHGGSDYSWLSGPNEGYGFGSSGPPSLSVDEHRERIRAFLAQVDPATGYLED